MSKNGINEPVAGNIEKLMKKQNLNRLSLARRAGYSLSDLVDLLESRRALTPTDLVTLCAALQTKPDDLFRQSDKVIQFRTK